VAELLAAIQDALELSYRQSMDGIDEATAEYHALLENNPEAVKRAIIDYTPVFAATCQGSAREEIAEAKGTYNLVYITVLIDEAARSNPLDLFIPMIQGSRRIILVGDHRQLPHIIDSEIERELERAVLEEDDKSVAEQTNKLIRESLFQRLFTLMRRREELDKIPRTITLNMQYRMHPKLGQFVSTQFYPADEQFGSGRPAEDFPLDLPGYEGRTAAWIDVPADEGPDRQDAKKSRFRVPEAETIASEVARLIKSPIAEAEKRTFGVITFYKAQEKEIKRALVPEGLMVDEGDDYAVASPYSEGERLRVGTVDAFQGKEFDVVFLSMVRSNRLHDRDELGRRSKYGHLMSPNRLCVSMSRQKQLLIVVGDAGMLRSPHATEAIGPLVAFHALAEGEKPAATDKEATP
jgi:superfamily I DNA and/or RNA helicase